MKKSSVRVLDQFETGKEFVLAPGLVGGRLRVSDGTFPGFSLRLSGADVFDWHGVECVNLRGVASGRILDTGKRVRRAFSVSLPSGVTLPFLVLSAFQPFQRVNDPEPLITAVFLHGLRFLPA